MQAVSPFDARDYLHSPPTVLRALKDDDCLRVFMAGNAYAYGVLYERYKTDIHRYAMRFFQDDVDKASDAFQDVFIKFYEKASLFRFESSFKTWLYAIAHNVCFNMTRRDEKQTDLNAYSEILPCEHTEHPDVQVHRLQVRELLTNAFDALPTDLREALTLREIDGLSYDGIAETTGTNVGIVRQRIWRAKQKLRSILSRHLGDDLDHRKVDTI